MNINNVIKCKFLKSDETITGSNITEIDIELDDLIKLISDVDIRASYNQSWFKSISDIREEKLNELGIK